MRSNDKEDSYKSLNCVTLSLQAANLKDCGVIREWIEPVRNHFWFCCQEANGDLPALKVLIVE